MAHIIIDTTKIWDEVSFHEVFQKALGFPDFYGKNMDAWIDCMSDLHEETGLCNVKINSDEMLHLLIHATSDFKNRQPHLMDELIRCAGFVNDRFVSREEKPKLCFIFLDSNS